jgi:hypothetical protein
MLCCQLGKTPIISRTKTIKSTVPNVISFLLATPPRIHLWAENECDRGADPANAAAFESTKQFPMSDADLDEKIQRRWLDTIVVIFDRLRATAQSARTQRFSTEHRDKPR